MLSWSWYAHIEVINPWVFLHFRVPVKEETMDFPSLARGSKRSLSGVSPPYAAPLSPKHLRAEAHPSEGTTHFSDLFMLMMHFTLKFKTLLHYTESE